ncbi:MAG: SEC-C metal-binding domain-containing protein [Candidatus Competibacter sp.]
MKKGYRVVRGNKELFEKLGRNDPCPCKSGRLFQAVLPQARPLLTDRDATNTFVDRT